MADIHPTAVVSPKAALGEGVRIGPLCTVGDHVTLGAGVVLHGHVAVEGHTDIGEGVQIFPFASVGFHPQDLKYAGEPSRLTIGAKTIIREQVTINIGTKGGGMITRVGAGCLLMIGVHIAHDCQVGDRVVMANNATLGGHVTIEDGAIIGGLSAIHQFVRIGRGAMIGGMSGVEHDVIPYGLVHGERASLQGLNLVGLKRRGTSREAIKALRELYDTLFGEQGTLVERLEILEQRQLPEGPASDVLSFVKVDSERFLCKPKHRHGA
ncbi:MAG: acyl-ACP--UDP-N-acetylglucosamine O-acyltransferase [Pseudomonadota bacterium]